MKPIERGQAISLSGLDRALQPIVKLATLIGFGFALAEHVWWLAAILALLLLVEVFLLPRMIGPFLISGKRLRFEGYLAAPRDVTLALTVATDPSPPTPLRPSAPPETTQSNEGQSA
jgi:hypothetical protein